MRAKGYPKITVNSVTIGRKYRKPQIQFARLDLAIAHQWHFFELRVVSTVLGNNSTRVLAKAIIQP